MYYLDKYFQHKFRFRVFFFKKQSGTSTENSVKVLLFNKCKMLKGLGLNCIGRITLKGRLGKK